MPTSTKGVNSLVQGGLTPIPRRDAEWAAGGTNGVRGRMPRLPGGASGDAAGLPAFVDMEFGPDRQVIGDFQGLLQRQIVLAEEIEDAASPREFVRGSAVEEQVVTLFRALGVGGRCRDDGRQTG